MSLTVMLAVLAAAALHASWNAIAKAASGKAGDVIAVGIAAGILAALALPVLPLPASASWPQLVASAIIHLAYFKLVEMAYRGGDLSIAYPLMRGTPPLITALGAWALLAEPLSTRGWAAIGIIVAGAAALAADGLRARHASPRTLAIVAANIVVIVAYTLVDGSGVRASGNAPSYIAWLFALTALTLVLARPWLGNRGLPQSRGAWGLLGAGAACTLGSYGIVLWAMTVAPIGLVAALRETSIVFGTMIAAAFLRERVSPQRWSAVALIAAGAALTKVA
jgi:drug/metabolite transporter (DMT)-like permease